jgi:hypothetical protein
VPKFFLRVDVHEGRVVRELVVASKASRVVREVFLNLDGSTVQPES